MSVFRAGHLEGKLEARGPLPELFQIQAWAASEDLADLTLGTSVPIESGEFALKVPAIPLDLRLAFKGWSPVYLWDIEPKAGEAVGLGLRPLQAGTSLCAFVVEEETGLPAVGARVLLRSPAPLPGTSAQDFARIGRLQWETTVNDRGFFQVSGALEGSFELELTRASEISDPPREPSLKIERIELTGGAETCLDDVFLPGKNLVTLRFLPPHCPDEKPWSVLLTKSRGTAAPPLRADVDEFGALDLPLAEGDYRLSVSTASGERVLRRSLSIDGPTDVEIEVDLVRLRGSLELAGEPVVGEIRLIGGESDARFEAGHDGLFEGWLVDPQGAEFVANVNSVLPQFSRWKELGPLESKEGEIRLAVDLGSSSLSGVVKDPSGQPLRRAQVTAADKNGMAVEALSDVEGRFNLEGLEPGSFKVWASLRGYGNSSTHRVTVPEEGQPAELELILSSGVDVEGRLETAAGLPVAGARLTIRFPGEFGWIDTVSSGADGSFRFRAPQQASSVAVTVSAPAVGMLWSVCRTLPEAPSSLLLEMPRG
ncbi:MAG: carboxypeptidase-like regulatory domain-containing protein, partial [Acidobacteriota bacterium]